MSHPLTDEEGTAVGFPLAGMKVTRHGDELHVADGRSSMVMLRRDTRIAPLPVKFLVFDANGEPVLPTKGKHFVISVATADPNHILAEMA